MPATDEIEVKFYYFEGFVGSTAPFGHVACSIRNVANGSSHYFSITSDGLRLYREEDGLIRSVVSTISKYNEKILVAVIDHEVGAFKTPHIKETLLPSVNKSFNDLVVAINLATETNRSNNVSAISNNCAHYVDAVLTTIYKDVDSGYESLMGRKKPILLTPGMVASNVYRKFKARPTQTIPYINFVKERFNSVIRSIDDHLDENTIIDDNLKDKIRTVKTKFDSAVKLIEGVHKHIDNPVKADQELTTSFLHLRESIDAVANEVKRLYPLRYYLYGLISIFCKNPALEYCKKFKKTVALANKESLFSWQIQRAKLPNHTIMIND